MNTYIRSLIKLTRQVTTRAQTNSERYWTHNTITTCLINRTFISFSISCTRRRYMTLIPFTMERSTDNVGFIWKSVVYILKRWRGILKYWNHVNSFVNFVYVEDTCKCSWRLHAWLQQKHYVFSSILSQISGLHAYSTGYIAWGFSLL
jgi:hypothetical protein